MNRVQNFHRSPWGFNNNSRGCSAAEPVVRKNPNHPNPAGVEQGSSGFQPESEGLQYKHETTAVLKNSTPTGSVKTAAFPNHGFRFTSPAAIIVMTPMGSDMEGGFL